MVKKKGKTMFQEFANWLANDAGDRSVLYKTAVSKEMFIIKRTGKKIKQ